MKSKKTKKPNKMTYLVLGEKDTDSENQPSQPVEKKYALGIREVDLLNCKSLDELNKLFGINTHLSFEVKEQLDKAASQLYREMWPAIWIKTAEARARPLGKRRRKQFMISGEVYLRKHIGKYRVQYNKLMKSLWHEPDHILRCKAKIVDEISSNGFSRRLRDLENMLSFYYRCWIEQVGIMGIKTELEFVQDSIKKYTNGRDEDKAAQVFLSLLMGGYINRNGDDPIEVTIPDSISFDDLKKEYSIYESKKQKLKLIQNRVAHSAADHKRSQKGKMEKKTEYLECASDSDYVEDELLSNLQNNFYGNPEMDSENYKAIFIDLKNAIRAGKKSCDLNESLFFDLSTFIVSKDFNDIKLRTKRKKPPVKSTILRKKTG